jgi:hypothetical protein
MKNTGNCYKRFSKTRGIQISGKTAPILLIHLFFKVRNGYGNPGNHHNEDLISGGSSYC